ncbi:hypothetical protein [Anaerotalea alkaliphila]|uniref:Uncharacterized protein n=1 Tax=Anaerotalea alkaliphila TaxID=2662126 RepID=A0A7X5KLZ2_9FIRM|nr:hypothetical protein [Anaerotalea alkaliphila]NDL67381.1 hypothetical protein [Anaerotalea alkaliphila]
MMEIFKIQFMLHDTILHEGEMGPEKFKQLLQTGHVKTGDRVLRILTERTYYDIPGDVYVVFLSELEEIQNLWG